MASVWREVFDLFTPEQREQAVQLLQQQYVCFTSETFISHKKFLSSRQQMHSLENVRLLTGNSNPELARGIAKSLGIEVYGE